MVGWLRRHEFSSPGRAQVCSIAQLFTLHIPYSIMSVLTSVSGFAAFGVLVRTYALGLQRRPLLSSMLKNNKRKTTTPSLDAIY